MAANRYTTTLLRQRLGETLDSLLDKENPMELERAKVVADVAQVMINIAKVEIDHMRVTGGDGTGFIEEKEKEIRLPSDKPVDQLTAGISIRHAEDDDAEPYAAITTVSPSGVTIHRGSKY